MMDKPEPVNPEGLSPLVAAECEMLNHAVDTRAALLEALEARWQPGYVGWVGEIDELAAADEALREFKALDWWTPLRSAQQQMNDYRAEVRATFENALRAGAPREVIYELWLSDFACWKFFDAPIDTSPESGEDG
jgi:hypothetical protein